MNPTPTRLPAPMSLPVELLVLTDLCSGADLRRRAAALRPDRTCSVGARWRELR